MPTNVKKNGGLIFLTYLPHGSISVLRAFLFRVTSLTLSFDLRLPLTTPRLIRLPLLSSPTSPAVSPLRPLPRGNVSTSSASDLTLLGWTPSTGAAPPVAVSASPPPPPLLSSSSSSTSLAPLAKPSIRPAEPFKLSEIKDVKSYLDLQDEIAYYLRSEEYGTRRSDDLLITDPSNTKASRYWEGQLRVAVWNGGGSTFCSRTLGRVSTGKVLRC